MESNKELLYSTPFKIIMIGDSCAGKSSMLFKFVNGTFVENHKATIGLDLKFKHILLENKKIVKLKIWDTAGQERFRSIIKTYYTGAHGIVLVFDLSNKQSFDNLDIWMKEIDDISNKKKILILIGNKSDRIEDRNVSNEDINCFLEKYGKNIKYFECSSKNGTNIETAFINLATQLIETNFEGIEQEIMENMKYAYKDNNSSCCIIN